MKENFEKTRHKKMMIKLKNIIYEEKEMWDTMIEFYLIKRNLIISTIDANFVNFLEEYNRYKVEKFREN